MPPFLRSERMSLERADYDENEGFQLDNDAVSARRAGAFIYADMVHRVFVPHFNST